MMVSPEFWRKPQRTLVSDALLPLAWLYQGATRVRRALASSLRPDISLICVGNATLGGAGKTPACIELGKAALRRGLSVRFICRGYGGSIKRTQNLDPTDVDRADPRVFGDEALLLARLAPVLAGPNRQEAVCLAQEWGDDLAILDDGFQYPYLVPHFRLLLIDGTDGFGNGRLFPAGPLRQAPEQAYALADGIIITGDDRVDAKAFAGDRWLGFATRGLRVPDKLKPGTSVLGFAGIAHPKRFRQAISASGLKLQGFETFGDHQVITKKDFLRLMEWARSHQAELVTTEKDWMRLREDQRPHVIPLGLRITAEPKNLWDTILDRVEERK